MTSVEQSLKNLNTDSIDLLLLHRPAPFWNPAEISKAFDHLFRDGKVTHFGVSNFTKDQFETLNNFVIIRWSLINWKFPRTAWNILTMEI